MTTMGACEQTGATRSWRELVGTGMGVDESDTAGAAICRLVSKSLQATLGQECLGCETAARGNSTCKSDCRQDWS